MNDRAAELLAPFTMIERVRPRRPNDAELLSLAGVSRHGLYRLVESGAITCERGGAAPRCDGRKGTGRVYVTLADVAAWRASRFNPINETAAPCAITEAASEENDERNNSRAARHRRQEIA